jgi:hypothetical protein
MTHESDAVTRPDHHDEPQEGLRYLGEPGPRESSEDIGGPVEPSRYESTPADPDPEAPLQGDDGPIYHSHGATDS